MDITNNLESSGFKFYGHNRTDRSEKQDSLISFHYSIWKIEVDKSISFCVVGIYGTPYSPLHPVTLVIFLDEFPDFVGDILDSYRKFIICGDINIHCDIDDNYEKQC